MLRLKSGDIVKHYKGKDLVEQEIYEILMVNPEYSNTRDFKEEAVVMYTPLFRENKNIIIAYKDFVKRLSVDERIMCHTDQRYTIEHLTKDELEVIKTHDFIQAKEDYNKNANEREDNNNTKRAM